MTPVSHGAKLYLLPLSVMCVLAGCGKAPADATTATAANTVPVYDQATGRLERLESDQDGDGRVDATAYMDGTHIKYVEIDRDQDGTPDRWEYYVPNPTGTPGPGSPDGRNLLDHVEERSAPDAPVSRRETYVGGVISHAEEDQDLDGRTDKWEFFEAGVLARMELDIQGKGFPDRRFVYEHGNMVRMEADPDGDGVFTPIR